MRFTKSISIKEIAHLIDAAIIGDEEINVTGINEIHKVMPGDVTFVDVSKYFTKALQSKATVILINERVDCPEGKVLLYCEDPFACYNRLVRKYRAFQPLSNQISESAVVHPSAVIEPNVVLGHHVKVGAGSFIRANAVIHDHTIIGKDVIIQSGTVIGTDAFYYKRRPDFYEKMESCGRVVIHDRVEIGACCTIDKGVSGDTIIGEGTKLDNQVHVAHGVVIGKNCLIAAQVGIAGKTILGDEVKLWGQVGISPRLNLGNGAEVYAQSGVAKDLKADTTYFGSPAVEVKEWFSDYRNLKRLPRVLASFPKLLGLLGD